MKNNIQIILDQRDLSVSDLQRAIIRNGQTCSFPTLQAIAGPNAGLIADGVQIGTLRKIAGALGVGICDLIGEKQ
jgi:hypothetical protein